MFYLSLGLNASAGTYILTRGGSYLLDVDYILENCNIEEGLGSLDNKRLRHIVSHLYKHKRKGKIIYITGTALCHLANQYELNFPAFPIAIGDFGLTNLYQTVRKTIVIILLGAVGPAFVYGAVGSALILALLGFGIAVSNLDLIATTPVYETGQVKSLSPRILDSIDVVVVNSRNKLTMSKPVHRECWLPDQAVLNSNCNV